MLDRENAVWPIRRSIAALDLVLGQLLADIAAGRAAGHRADDLVLVGDEIAGHGADGGADQHALVLFLLLARLAGILVPVLFRQGDGGRRRPGDEGQGHAGGHESVERGQIAHVVNPLIQTEPRLYACSRRRTTWLLLFAGKPISGLVLGRIAIVAEFETHIGKVGFQGDGIASDGGIVPLTLPGERVRVRPGKDRLELTAVLDPSPQRVSPPCPHFTACGGCALQHWDMAAYSAWKREMVQVMLGRAGFAVEVAPILTTPPHSRRRVGLHARRQGRQVDLGYKMRRSWSLVPIHACTIADPAIVGALPQLKALAAPLFGHPKSAPILHVTVSLTGLDIDISGVERSHSGGLSGDARLEIAQVAAAADFARVTLAGDILYGARTPMIAFGRARIGLPQGSFLQASAQSEADMVRLVAGGVGNARRVADLFCGAGAFTFPLAEGATVRAVDGSAPAIAALRSAIASAPGLKTITPEARDLFRRPLLAEDMKGLDAIVFDPPRAGAEAQSHEIARSGITRAVAVSCHPATFVRDAKILVNAGFSLDSVTPIDQFLWSPHVELVGIFSR